jgi:hypothetical protein
MNRILSALVAVLLCAPAAAENDESKAASPSSAPRAAQPVHARHLEAEATVMRKGEKRSKAAEARPTAAGQLTGSVQNHPLWVDLSALMRDSRMSYVRPEVRRSIESRYQAIAGERSGLIPRASSLDATDDRLIADGRALNTEKAGQDAELADLISQIDAHNARCNPAPDDAAYAACVANASRLNSWRDNLNDRIADYNGRVRVWHATWERLKSDWSGFVTTIEGWGQRMKALIEDILKNLTMVGDCTAEQHRKLQDEVNRACKRPRACKGDQDCATLIANLAKNRECAAARKAINDTCFKGGDEGHKQAYQEALNAVGTCLDLMKKKKCEEGGVGVDPAKR